MKDIVFGTGHYEVRLFKGDHWEYYWFHTLAEAREFSLANDSEIPAGQKGIYNWLKKTWYKR